MRSTGGVIERISNSVNDWLDLFQLERFRDKREKIKQKIYWLFKHNSKKVNLC